jgi:hypothetical protein
MKQFLFNVMDYLMKMQLVMLEEMNEVICNSSHPELVKIVTENVS